ncbi:MAG: DNA polymerase III subunit delta [Candidatus Moranbacteria bacterium]|nr:DNA polymerase III subunit delta [Candidatus Moranbacteria bacterium]
MIFFLHGEDGFRVNERRSVFQKTFAKKHPQAEFFIFDFEDQGTPDDVKRSLAACEEGLFTTKKMVTFLHPFVLGETQEKLLLNFLECFVKKTNAGVALLFINPGKIKKTHPLTQFLVKHADKVEMIEKLETKNIDSYIKRELAAIDEKASFSREALQVFISSLGTATERIRTELEKLVTFKPGGVFETEDVRLLVGSSPESIIFEALDALGRGDKKRALLLFHREVSGVGGAYPLLSMCAWQARRLLRVREIFDRGVRRAGDIASETKLPPFVVQKMLGTINNFPLSRIKRGLSLLSEFDTQLKTGGMDPLVALDLFIWKF